MRPPQHRVRLRSRRHMDRDRARLPGKGLPRFRGGGRGDLFVRLQVRVPEKRTRGERRLYELLRAEGRKRPSDAS